MCEDVGNLSYFKAKSAKDWNYFKGNHTPRFVDRAWNDPEEDIVYEIFKKAEKSLDFEAEYSISIIFGNFERERKVFGIFWLLGKMPRPEIYVSID